VLARTSFCVTIYFMIELQPNQLWYPGQDFSLSAEYPEPSDQELIELWRDYSDNDAVVSAPNVYGVLNTPSEPPTSYASIDLCEVVRNTHTGLRLVEEPLAGELTDIHDYGSKLTIGNGPDITTVLQVLMHARLIEPVDTIKPITSMLQRWRQDGTYVFANTSTLPGCEAATIEFFKTHMPDAFDGLLLPRNHDSTLPLTKGVAAAGVIGSLSAATAVRIVHIDDKPPHNTAFHRAFEGQSTVTVATIQPNYPSSYTADQNSIIAADPLSAFQAADAFLRA
jgi:hypothetical protein